MVSRLSCGRAFATQRSFWRWQHGDDERDPGEEPILRWRPTAIEEYLPRGGKQWPRTTAAAADNLAFEASPDWRGC